MYAGAYACGRTESRVELRDGRKKITRKVVSNRDDWQVFLPDSHEGYLEAGGKYMRFPDERLYDEYGLVRLKQTAKGLPWAKA